MSRWLNPGANNSRVLMGISVLKMWKTRCQSWCTILYFIQSCTAGCTWAKGNVHSTSHLLHSAGEHPGTSWGAQRAPYVRCSPPVGLTPCCWKKTAAASQSTPWKTPPSSAHRSLPLSRDGSLILDFRCLADAAIQSDLQWVDRQGFSVLLKTWTFWQEPLSDEPKPRKAFAMDQGLNGCSRIPTLGHIAVLLVSEIQVNNTAEVKSAKITSYLWMRETVSEWNLYWA